MGALTKTVAPGLAGSPDSGGSDLLHLILGSHAAGQGGLNPLVGLLGGIQSMATGGQPHSPQTLHDLIQQMGLQVKPPQTMGGPATPGFGMNPQTIAPAINPQVATNPGMQQIQTTPAVNNATPFTSGIKKPGTY